jgi:putative tricarboxylic transport membrane protein
MAALSTSMVASTCHDKINLNTFDIAMTVAFGFAGYVLRQEEFDLGPLILAFVLGPTSERSLRQMLLITEGDLFLALWERPIALTLVALALAFLVTGLFGVDRCLPHDE